MTRYQSSGWHFAARQNRNGKPGFVAWCKRGVIETDCPAIEPGEVWFDFGQTADEAIARLVRELGAGS